ncbi:MAG: hypothetical protein WAJ91_09340 [Rhodoplanes sp.]
MLSHRLTIVVTLGLTLLALGAGGYALWRSKEPVTLAGVVRTTEIRVAPEVGGQLAASGRVTASVEAMSSPSSPRSS